MSKLRIIKINENEYDYINNKIFATLILFKNKDNLIMYMNHKTLDKILEYNGANLIDTIPKSIFGVEIICQDMNDNEIHIVEYEDNYYKICMNSLYGMFYNGFTRENPTLPDKYIVNKDACILFYGNNKTIVKRATGDRIDPVKAFLWAYFLKHTGMSRTKANKYLQKVKDTALDNDFKFLKKK